MAFSDAIPGFMEMMNQPTFLERKRADRQKQFNAMLEQEKTLADLSDKRQKLADQQRQQKLKDRLNTVSNLKDAADLYIRRGQPAAGRVKKVVNDMVQAGQTELLPVLGQALQGDRTAYERLSLEERSIRRQLGEDIDTSGEGGFHLMKDGTVEWTTGQDPFSVRPLDEIETKMVKSRGGASKVNKNQLFNTDKWAEEYAKQAGLDKGEAVTLSDAETSDLGFPEGSIVQRKPDGTLTAVFKPSAGDQRDRRIQALVDQGVDRDRATNIVDGNVKIEANPKTGKMVLTDMVTNTVQEIPLEGGTDEIPGPEETLYELAPLATGVVSGAKELYADVAGQVGADIPERTVEARQTMQGAVNDLIRAMSINPRFPVGEINRIKEEIKMEPSVLRSSGALQARMRSIDKFLNTRLQQAERDANDPNLPEDVRSSQTSNASAIRNFLSVLGVPNLDLEAFESKESIQNMSLDELREFVQNADDETLNNLPNADLVMERLNANR